MIFFRYLFKLNKIGLIKIFTLFSLIFLLFTCKRYEAQVPSYLVINKFNLASNYATYGSSSNKIDDVAIEVDNVNYGIHELPCKVPILTNGVKNVLIKPYVKESGQTFNKINYFYYKNYTGDVNFKLNDTTELIPKFEYQPYTKLQLNEDFESSAISISKTANSLSNLQFETISKKEGLQSGKTILTKTNNYFEAVSNLSYNLPTTGDLVYCELDYSCTNNFSIGLQFVQDGILKNADSFVFTPSTTDFTKPNYKKAYINLTYVTAGNPTAKNFKLRFVSLLDTTHANDIIYLDNLKIITNQ